MIIDYAYPCMTAERSLKDAHLAMLEKDYDKAAQCTVEAIIAVSRMYEAVNHMKEKDYGLRKQA